jgi:PAS domain S-box-containing protein
MLSTHAAGSTALSADFRALFEATPTPFLVVAPPDWTIVAANDARIRLTGVTREEQLGRRLFDVFPDDPDDPNADGVRNLTASLARVVANKAPDVMAVQRYALRGPEGRFVERWWSPINSPVLDEAGEVAMVIHRVEDVTDLMRLRGEADARDQLARDQQALIDRLRVTEEALRESERRFRNVADHAPVMMWVTDPSGSCTYLNARWYEFTGQRLGDGQGYGWLDAVHPEDRPVAEQAFVAANAERRHYRVDFRLRRSDGAYRWVIDAAAARFAKDGEFLGYVGSVIDIDERREAETRLAFSEEQLRLATEVAEVGQWDIDPSTNDMFWPPRVKAMFGISPHVPVTLDDFHNGVHPDDREKTRSAYEAASNPDLRALYDVEYRTVGKEDGIVRWVAAKGRGLFDAEGTCTRIIGTAIDITARKADELRLRELNELLEQKVAEQTAERNRVWEMSRDLFAIMGFDGHLKAINPAWKTTLGRDMATLLSLPFPEQVHPDDHVAVRAVMEVLLRGESVSRFEDRLRHADGSWRWISWTLVPEGDVFYAVGRDVTAEKAAAVKLVEAQEQLRQAQKMEAIGQLTGGIAHDFNNLLAGISGSLEMLVTRIAQGRLDTVDRYVNAAQASARRAAALTQRLLAFSRRQTLDPKPTDVNRLIAGMEDLVRRTVGPGIEIEIVGASGLWLTKVDAPQLENALLNLSINARDAMPEGGRITVETANKWLDDRASKEQDLSPGQYVTVCVTDTGTGMTKDVIAKAFDPFFTTKPIGQGTGLGLSMIHGFVRQSGGQVRIYSEVEKGTTVCLYLPRLVGEREEAAETSEVASSEPGQGETVLVIDDEPTVLMLMQEVLEEAGYRVLEAKDGPSGLKMLNSDIRIDLLVTDVGLPGGMNGRQVADAARRTRPELRVLFVTGYAENAAVGNGHLDPGMEVITKPFAMAEFESKVRALVPGGT